MGDRAALSLEDEIEVVLCDILSILVAQARAGKVEFSQNIVTHGQESLIKSCSPVDRPLKSTRYVFGFSGIEIVVEDREYRNYYDGISYRRYLSWTENDTSGGQEFVLLSDQSSGLASLAIRVAGEIKYICLACGYWGESFDFR